MTSPDELRLLPKVSLHDHLDGSVAPTTLIELAAEQGVPLPHTDPRTLAGWFRGTVAEPAVSNWDEKFGLTTRLMQDPASLARVAREFVLQLAADGVIVGETRWAPEKHLAGGMSLDDAVRAVAAGLQEGEQLAQERGTHIQVRQILCGMRTGQVSARIAELAVRHRDTGVVGFDIAGEERGYPAAEHVQACRIVQAAGLPLTFHTGEHDGLASVRETVEVCRPQRLGHGVRIVEDMTVGGRPVDARSIVAAARDATPVLGPLATRLRDEHLPLEVCLTSNSSGTVVDDPARHPVDLLHRMGFTVTINPDNRMMSATSVTQEMRHLVELFGWTRTDLLAVTRNALYAAFLPAAERDRLLDEVVLPGWAG